MGSGEILWGHQRVPGKQFSKHVEKVIMTLPKEEAMTLMRRIAMEREKWEFKSYTI